ncbi:XapX domain-containing protein [Haloterrigena sp. SYSU A558-1]|uniref:XapX domain-containing protein n=1 Tax=Haloterrigena gelatinilytica TaxID=2741724 RepID=A0ABX2LB29_9EURY|nr:XapX domain-containing protein [Haloterrigena gelatinilytica]NUC72598.1 XapX domain-containing protein [Haloterrigena gelatinilytica]
MVNLTVAFGAALIAGLVLGSLYGFLGLPSPAPGSFAGVLAVSGSVCGIFLGYALITTYLT